MGNLYDKEVSYWLINHSFVYTFFWGLVVTIASLIFMPLEFYWWIREKVKK